MSHPLRHRGKLILLHVIQNAHKFQDVRVGQRIPEDYLFAKLLGDGLSVPARPQNHPSSSPF